MWRCRCGRVQLPPRLRHPHRGDRVQLAKDGGSPVDQFGILDPLIGIVFAFVSAVLAIRWLISYLSTHDLTTLAWYRFAVAAITIVLIATSVI